jgi:NAD(P)-dependent dehydrogenase (short-subunit alcohol dehydrogenase family)
MKVHEKVAIVTGATTGLGLAVTRLLLSNGYCVLATYLQDPDNEIPTFEVSSQLVFFQADLLNPAQSADSIIENAINAFGKLDLVVSSAARILYKEVTHVSQGDWEEVMAVNLFAPFFLATKSLPFLAETRGSVINISSTNAVNVNHKNQLYDTSKAALNHLTQGLAIDFANFGVRVNAIMPGGMQTPLLKEWVNQAIETPVNDFDFSQPNIARPEDVARVVLALAGDEMRWVNGAIITADNAVSLQRGMTT